VAIAITIAITEAEAPIATESATTPVNAGKILKERI
jgi:hypothetical protein